MLLEKLRILELCTLRIVMIGGPSIIINAYFGHLKGRTARGILGISRKVNMVGPYIGSQYMLKYHIRFSLLGAIKIAIYTIIWGASNYYDAVSSGHPIYA